MAFWLNLAGIFLLFGMGVVYCFKPTAFNNSPIKLPFSERAQSSPTWLAITRVLGAAMVAWSLYSLAILLRHQFKL